MSVNGKVEIDGSGLRNGLATYLGLRRGITKTFPHTRPLGIILTLLLASKSDQGCI